MAMATSSELMTAAVRLIVELRNRVDVAVGSDSRLDDSEHLALGDDIINVDEYQLEFARCG